MEPKDGNHTEVLSRLYYRLSDPDSFSNPSVLLKRAKKEGVDVSMKQVKDWLKQQVSYTRHSRPTYVFPRRKILTLRSDSCWAADLIQVEGLSSYNSNYQYILVVTDLFAKKVWLRKLRHKSKKEMETAFRSIISENDNRSPYRLWTDRGTVSEKWERYCVVEKTGVELMFLEGITSLKRLGVI